MPQPSLSGRFLTDSDHMLALIYHKQFARHLEGYAHVEQPARLQTIMSRLQNSSLLTEIELIEPAPAERDWLTAIHSEEYVDQMLTLEVETPIVLDWGDTVATEAIPKAARLAAGATVTATQLVLNGCHPVAFCAVRPPGHHAEPDRAMGFCIFNNIAVAARWLIDHGKLERVAIIDWDVHHGNGTERIFLNDPRVFYISLHQFPHYPGTGAADIIGTGNGEGFNLNIPMNAGDGDAEYLTAFDDKVIPALDEYAPQFILISAGFDAHNDDPLSDICLSTEVYAEFTRRLCVVADRHADGRIVSVLEGGYNLDALAASVESHLQVLSGRS